MAAIEEEISRAANLDEAELRQLKEQTVLSLKLNFASRARPNESTVRPNSFAPKSHQVVKEGDAKKQERDEISQRLEKLGDIEARLAEAEAELRSLNDPRGRAAALSTAYRARRRVEAQSGRSRSQSRASQRESGTGQSRNAGLRHARRRNSLGQPDRERERTRLPGVHRERNDCGDARGQGTGDGGAFIRHRTGG